MTEKNAIIQTIAKDLYVYIVCLIAICLSLYAITHTQQEFNRCNDFWKVEYKALQDRCIGSDTSSLSNILVIGDLNASKSINYNP